MKPIETKSTNAVYVLEGCHDLPVTKFESNIGVGVEACFEIEPDELEEIKRTGKVYLNILGNSVPPVRVAATSALVDKDDENNHTEKISHTKKEYQEALDFLFDEAAREYYIDEDDYELMCYDCTTHEKYLKPTFLLQELIDNL